jgi:hypothetical protein
VVPGALVRLLLVAGIHLLDLDDRPVTPLPGPGDPTTVFVFTSTDCPIANRYAPELERIHDRFAHEGVRFWSVYADPSELGDAIRRHAGSFGHGFAALRDPRHDLVRLSGASVTPEAAVFVGGAEGPRLVYRGRIDDRNVALGRTRPAPTSHDLEDVLVAIGSGKAVPTRTTAAIGCAIPPLE